VVAQAAAVLSQLAAVVPMLVVLVSVALVASLVAVAVADTTEEALASFTMVCLMPVAAVEVQDMLEEQDSLAQVQPKVAVQQPAQMEA